MFTDVITELHSHAPALAALAMLVVVLTVGTAAQILAERLQIPATGPLLVAGLALGPDALGVVVPDLLGDLLRVVVRAAVAVCVFEGGLLLDVGELRRTSRAVAGLVTAGLAITTALAGAAAHVVVGWSWELSLLFGAIVSVTGPTVITPIMQKVRVNSRVRATLESESVIADPLGVILAALVFTAILSPGGVGHAVGSAAGTLGVGVAVGAVVAGAVWLAAGYFHLLPAKYARLAILGAALVAYTAAELAAHEAGVLAAAVAGIAIGSLDIPHKQHVEEFKGDVASIAVSAVFILLAASLGLGDLTALGWRGAAVVALLMAVVRPATVFLSTWGSELRAKEKLFVALLGPRGIVAASVATFFGLELVDAGYPEGRRLVALVFGVVIATVLVEGSAAGWLARRLNVMAKGIVIVGADEAGRLLAEALATSGESVSLVDTDSEKCAIAVDSRDVRVICGDGTDASVLRRAGAADAKCLVASTPSDKANLLVCQVARTEFAVPRLVARASSASNVAAFEAAGIETMTPAGVVATVLENMVLRPNLFRLLAAGARSDHVAEVVVASDERRATSLAELALGGVVIAVVRRGDQLIVPKGSTRIRPGDVLTLVGDEAAVRRVRERLGEP